MAVIKAMFSFLFRFLQCYSKQICNVDTEQLILERISKFQNITGHKIYTLFEENKINAVTAAYKYVYVTTKENFRKYNKIIFQKKQQKHFLNIFNLPFTKLKFLSTNAKIHSRLVEILYSPLLFVIYLHESGYKIVFPAVLSVLCIYSKTFTCGRNNSYYLLLFILLWSFHHLRENWS